MNQQNPNPTSRHPATKREALFFPKVTGSRNRFIFSMYPNERNATMYTQLFSEPEVSGITLFGS